MKKKKDYYTLSSLKDARGCINEKVNLLAVVVEFSLRRKSKGTDHYCTLKVVDDSYPTPAVSVNFFAQNPDELPRVKKPGDLIHVSKVKMRYHEEEVVAQYDKVYSSFALFEGKNSNSITPYQCSTNFCRRDCKEYMTHLRKWLLTFQLDAGRSEFLLPLKEIKGGQRFDVVCKILFSHEISEKDSWILYVWDGTDTPSLSIRTMVGDEVNSPLPLQVDSSLSRDTLSSFPRVGSILRVEVEQAQEYSDLHLLRSGLWVRLRSITCREHLNSAIWKGTVESSCSKIYCLSEEVGVVIKCLGNYNKRISSKWGRLPCSILPRPSSITETEYRVEQSLTLMDVLTHAEVNAKFTCIVRVMAMCPWHVEDFRSPIDPHLYRIRLTLEDPTARIHAYVYGEDGVKFFKGYPSFETLAKKRNKLLGIAIKDNGEEDETLPRNPPWVQCCIKSHYLKKDNAWGTRQFRIFDTTLVG